MISKNLRTCLKELKLLDSIKDKKSRAIVLKYLSEMGCIYDAMREIAVNILNKNIPLRKSHLQKLGKHAKVIEALACGTEDNKQRCKFVSQFGGIPPLLPIIIPILASLAGATAGKVIDKVIPD